MCETIIIHHLSTVSVLAQAPSHNQHTLSVATCKQRTPLPPTMASLMQPTTGPDWWISGKVGHLAPWAQAVVQALVKVSDAFGLDLSDADIGSYVTKVGGGQPKKDAIRKWRGVFEDDPDWYPGKTAEGNTPGPKRLRTVQKEQAMAKCAMSVKDSGAEPTAAIVKERCPVACLNPTTGEPFTDKYMLEVFRKRCYDEGCTQPWSQEFPLQKTALPDFLKEHRATWGAWLLVNGQGAGWYHRHCIWVDPCYHILSTSERQVFDLNNPNSGKKKRWVSKDGRQYARNMRASPYAGKQQQHGYRKVWWFVVLARGRVHVEVMGGAWRQDGEGMAQFVERLPRILPEMLGRGEALPRVVASDRGPGFYQSSTGHIVRRYADALDAAGFRPFAGKDAASQPPDISDVLLHETVVGWIRNYFKKHAFPRVGSLDVQEVRLRHMLDECVNHINEITTSTDCVEVSLADWSSWLIRKAIA